MQSSGTSTPAGGSPPGSGRAFPKKAGVHPEIAPPRLWRTPYPAGRSPLVLPELTRASSSFTITSNHQNILPLWPAAPPPGQPVVFFRPLLRPVRLPVRPAAGCARGTGARLCPGPAACAAGRRDGGGPFLPGRPRSSAARQSVRAGGRGGSHLPFSDSGRFLPGRHALRRARCMPSSFLPQVRLPVRRCRGAGLAATADRPDALWRAVLPLRLLRFLRRARRPGTPAAVSSRNAPGGGRTRHGIGPARGHKKGVHRTGRRTPLPSGGCGARDQNSL